MTGPARRRLAALALAAVLGACAVPAGAQDGRRPPLVGGVLLDPVHDVEPLQRVIGTSLAIQAGRQTSTALAALAMAGRLELDAGTTSLDGTLRETATRSAETHRRIAVLAAVGLGCRGVGAGITFGARGSLATALAGFTVPFLLGAAVDLLEAALSYVQLVELIVARDSHALPAPLEPVWRGSEAVHLLTGLLSTLSLVTQLGVFSTARSLARYERLRERRAAAAELSLAASPAGVTVTLRF